MIYTIALIAVAGAAAGLPVRAPGTVGMSAHRLEAISRVVEDGINAGGYPGASVVVGRKGSVVLERGYGRLSWPATSPHVTADNTIYDLASLTKVIGTTTAIMVLYDQGRIALDAPVAAYLPAFSGGYKDSVTVRQLLTHRSGLPAGRDLWRLATNPEDARRYVIDTPLECRPGDCFIYSDLGFDLLGLIVQSVSGEPLDVFLGEHVFQPLGMARTFFRPADSVRTHVAPTEVNPPRGYPLQGEVHDENAYALGGVAGHAGLFSTATDLAIFAQMLLNGGVYGGVRVVGDSTVALFTKRAAGTRALGWDTCDDDGGSSCGRYLSDRAYGHTGFTGTSIWVDPDRQTFVILLTNRVHDARARRPAKVIADVRADLADATASSIVDDPSGSFAVPVIFRSDRRIGWNRVPRTHRSARSRAAHRARRSHIAAQKKTTS